jgi:hypothetical protein
MPSRLRALLFFPVAIAAVSPAAGGAQPRRPVAVEQAARQARGEANLCDQPIVRDSFICIYHPAAL